MQAEQQSERERFDHLVSGQAQNLIGALIAHGLLQKSLPEELYLKLWEVVEQQLHAVNREGARAALSHPSTPQGWQLVPVEPTEEMLAAGEIPTIEMPLRGGGTYQMLGLGAGPSSIYRKMLAVSPPPPEQGSKG